ncbi:MAG: S24/S26 family peptidase [Prevotella sp.]|nr:S24/S26 family peptidase [Prevotella sp.]
MPSGTNKTEIREVQFSNADLLPEIIRLIEEGHSVTLRLRGVSMRPFLEDNRDKALLTRSLSPKVGEPVLAETAPRHYVLHRIVNIDGEDVTLLGDGNPISYKEHCKLSDIKAHVEGFYRKGRTKMDRVDGWKWKTYSWLWMHMLPLRRYMLAVYRRLIRLENYLNRRRNNRK